MKILDVPQSGSVAGDTSSRNRFGQYRRTRAVPVQPSTERQRAVRAQMATASQNWGQILTDPQRASWSAFADERGLTDSLGQTIYLSGAQTYVAFATLYAQLGKTFTKVPPTEAAPAAPVNITLTATPDELTFIWGHPVGADLVVVSVSGPVSPGISFSPRLTLMGSIVASGESFELDVIAAYKKRYGLPPVGRKIFWSLTALNTVAGTYKSQPVTGSAIIEAASGG